MFLPLVFSTKSILGPEQDQRQNKRIHRSVSINPSSSSPLWPHSITFTLTLKLFTMVITLRRLGLDRIEGKAGHSWKTRCHPRCIRSGYTTLWIESLQQGEQVGVNEVVIAEGGMEIDVERDNNMMGEKQEAIYATCGHEAEDIKMSMKAERWKRMRILTLRWSHQATLILVPIFTLNIEHLLILVCNSSDPIASIPHTRPLILNLTTMMSTPRLFHPPLRIVVVDRKSVV